MNAKKPRSPSEENERGVVVPGVPTSLPKPIVYTMPTVYVRGVSENEIGLREGRAQFGELVSRAEYAGTITYITRHGRPVAAIVPVNRVAKEPIMTPTFIFHGTRGYVRGSARRPARWIDDPRIPPLTGTTQRHRYDINSVVEASEFAQSILDRDESILRVEYSYTLNGEKVTEELARQDVDTPEPAMPEVGKTYRGTHKYWGWPATQNILITETAPATGETLARVRYRLASEEASEEVWTYLAYFESLVAVLPEGTLCARSPEHTRAGVLATSERYYSGKTKSGFIGFCDECAAMQDATDKGA